MTVQLGKDWTCIICLEELPGESSISLKQLGSVISIWKKEKRRKEHLRKPENLQDNVSDEQGQNEVVHFHHTQ